MSKKKNNIQKHNNAKSKKNTVQKKKWTKVYFCMENQIHGKEKF